MFPSSGSVQPSISPPSTVNQGELFNRLAFAEQTNFELQCTIATIKAETEHEKKKEIEKVRQELIFKVIMLIQSF